LGQKWLATKNGTIAALSNWAQGYRCEDYEPVLSDRKADVILRLCDDRYSGVVHPDSDILTIHADTQDNGFWYEIRGWQCPKGKRNDLWDCAQMGIALTRYLGFHKMVSEKKQSSEKIAQPKNELSHLTGSAKRPGWFNTRRR